MKIFVMRHGEATYGAPSDMQRPLSPRGEDQALSAACWLRAKYFVHQNNFDYALVSPYLRTKQTFAKIVESFTVTRTEYTQDVIPSSVAALTHDYVDMCLSLHCNIDNLLVVSHMPFVSYFVDSLCQTSNSPIFATASIAVIDYNVEQSRGTLIEHQQHLCD